MKGQSANEFIVACYNNGYIIHSFILKLLFNIYISGVQTFCIKGQNPHVESIQGPKFQLKTQKYWGEFYLIYLHNNKNKTYNILHLPKCLIIYLFELVTSRLLSLLNVFKLIPSNKS